VMVGAAVLALVAGWFALARPSGHPSVRPSPDRSPTSSHSPGGESLTAVFTIAHVRVRGQVGDVGAYRGPAGNLCLRLPTLGTISCDFAPRPGQAVRLAYANWLYPDSADFDIGVFLAGAVSPRVASVRVSLGAGRWVDATILSPPPEVGFPFRLFYMEKRTGFESLNRSLPVVALDGHGREIGRTSYLIQGG
jgi:hypothetical protein